MTDDILALCDKRRDTKKNKKTNQNAANRYIEANSNIKKKTREAKEQWTTDQCIDIEAGMRTGNSKVAIDTL